MNRINHFILRCVHFILRHAAAADETVERKLRETAQASDRTSELLPPMEPDPFFRDVRIITHAGGGMRGLRYLNCAEAYPYYYAAGNRVFEYDVQQGVNGEFRLSHDSEADELIDERFHPLPLSVCLEHLSAHEDTVVIFDCKFRDIGAFAVEIRRQLTQEDELQRIVIQVFNEENILQVREAGPFRMLFVCMMATEYVEAANLCLRYRIGAVSISAKALRERTGWEAFSQSNLCTFAYTVNTVAEYRRLRNAGITGVFSDFLADHEIGRTNDETSDHIRDL